MTPSEYVKNQGLSGIAEMSRMTGKNRTTLDNWCNNQRKLFDIILIGCLATKAKEGGVTWK